MCTHMVRRAVLLRVLCAMPLHAISCRKFVLRQMYAALMVRATLFPKPGCEGVAMPLLGALANTREGPTIAAVEQADN